MRLRPIDPYSPAFGVMRSALEAAGLPTEDLLDEPARYFAHAQQGGPTAFVGLLRWGPDALLRSLVVSDGARGKGLGSSLLEILADHAAGEGVERLWLLTLSAQGYFSDRGWRTVPREQAPGPISTCRQFTTTCSDSAVLMCRTLA